MKPVSSLSAAVGRTPRHTPRLAVRIQLALEDVEAIVHCAASASGVGQWIAQKLVVCKTAFKYHVGQGDGSHLFAGNFIVNTWFNVFDFVACGTSATVVGRYSLDAEVLDIENQDCMSWLFWLTQNRLLVDTQPHCLRNAIPALVSICSVRCIPSVTKWYLYL